jgi:ATP-dependent Clp protease ATP-binding subunit ClpA
MNLLRASLRPEFLNRIDEIAVFKPLNEMEIKRIVDLEFAAVIGRLSGNGLAAKLKEDAKNYLAHRGYDPQFGARPLKRVIKRLLTDQLANSILSGSFVPGDMVKIDANSDGLTFHIETQIAIK